MKCGYCGAPNRTVRQCKAEPALRRRKPKRRRCTSQPANAAAAAAEAAPPESAALRVPAATQATAATTAAAPRHDQYKSLPVELYQLRRTLGDAVRDRNVRRLRSDIVDRDGEHCYYLRSRRPRTDVDHAFECQAMGHSLTQCESWHRFYREEAFIDGKVSRHGALRKLCDSVASVQNSLENLHLLDDGLNRSKRHAFEALATRRICRMGGA